MKLWLLLVLTFFIQESVSTGAILLEAYRSHYNPWIIHLIFTTTTLLDIVVGYYLGLLIDKRFGREKTVAWIKSKFKKFSDFFGEHGKVVALLVYAPILFPFSGIFVPWLDISLSQALVLIFIGETVLWYLPEWLLVLGVRTFLTNPASEIVAIVALSVLLFGIPVYFAGHKQKK